MTEIPGGPGQIPDRTLPTPSAAVSFDKDSGFSGEGVESDQPTGAVITDDADDMATKGPDGEFLDLDGDDADLEARDWAWVEEWREGGEPVPWGPGLALAGFALFLVASAVYVLSAGLSDHPILAIGINIIVAGGLGPALWLSRGLPVLRWISGGAVLGVLVAWLSVLIFLT